MATKVETTAAPAKPAAEPKPIKLSAVTIHEHGFCYKTVVISMGDDISLDDIGNKPSIWKAIQADRNGKALVEDDKVELRWFDKRVYAVVDYSDSESVALCGIRKVDKRDRDREPFNDGTYAVRFTTSGWSYFRIRDGVMVGNASYPTWEAARAALIREQYPAKVA